MAETTSELADLHTLAQGENFDRRQRLGRASQAESQLAKAYPAVEAEDFADAYGYLSTVVLWESEMEGDIANRRSLARKLIYLSLRQGAKLLDEERFEDILLIRRIATDASLVGDLVWEEGQRGNDEKFTPDFQRVLAFCDRVAEKKQAVVTRLVGKMRIAVGKGDIDAARAIHNEASALLPNDKELLDLKENLLTPEERAERSQKMSEEKRKTRIINDEKKERAGLAVLWPRDTDVSRFEAAERGLLVSLRIALAMKDYNDAMGVLARLRLKYPDDNLLGNIFDFIVAKQKS